MRIMVLGSGPNQLNGIKQLQLAGHWVLACDYNEQSVGKRIADQAAIADAFNATAIERVAKRYSIERIVVFATDQPVLTAAIVSERLALPYHLTVAQARMVTHKHIMKAKLKQCGLPVLDFITLDSDATAEQLAQLQFPAVIKPVDSQGQRGIFKVQSSAELLKKLTNTLTYSKVGLAIVEPFYRSNEVTVSGWVDHGTVYILTLTDRVSFDVDDKIGICTSHEHPSKLQRQYGTQIQYLSEQVCRCLALQNGPFYYQFLVGDKGVIINEIASRIGGAHEDVFIKRLTGFDIMAAQIALSTSRVVDTSPLIGYSAVHNRQPLSVQLYFARQGQISSIDKAPTIEGLIYWGTHYQVGDRIADTTSAAARCGYGIIVAADEDTLIARIDNFYQQLIYRDIAGQSMLIATRRTYR